MYFSRVFQTIPKVAILSQLTITHVINSSRFVLFAVSDTSEINGQRVRIEFCSKHGKNATETYATIKTADIQ